MEKNLGLIAGSRHDWVAFSKSPESQTNQSNSGNSTSAQTYQRPMERPASHDGENMMTPSMCGDPGSRPGEEQTQIFLSFLL